MESSNLICDFCNEFYDLNDRLPIHFPHFPPCAKTTCLDCFNKTISSKGFNMKCPWDKQSLKPDAKGRIASLPNYQLQEKLEVNKDYEVCPDHPNEFLRLFCKTDKVKICTSCHLSTGKESHKNHDVDLIENLKPEIEERRRLHEEGLEKFKIFENAIQGGMNAKKKFFEEKIECQAKVHTVARLKTHLMVRDYLDSQKKNVQKKVQENFESQKQIKETIASWKELKKLNLDYVLSKGPEEIRAQYDEGKIDRVFAECENGMNQKAGELYEKFGSIYDQQEISSTLEFRSNLSIHLDGQNLKIVAKNITKTVLVDVAKFKEIKTMTIVFDAFDFNQEDMKVIEFVFSSLQDQLSSIELCYKNIKDRMTLTKFETHVVFFSVMIFTNPKNYKSIALTFENSDGSERYLRFLGENVFSEIDLLESFALTLKNQNINEEILANFFHQARPYFKGLKSLSLNIEGNLISSQILDQEVVFELPKLERLNLAFNVRVLFGRSIGTVLEDILASIKSLKICRICMENSPKSGLSFIKTTLSFPEIEVLIIEMPHSLFHEKDIELLKLKLKKHLKELKTLEIFSNTFNDQSNLPPVSTNPFQRPLPSISTNPFQRPQTSSGIFLSQNLSQIDLFRNRMNNL